MKALHPARGNRRLLQFLAPLILAQAPALAHWERTGGLPGGTVYTLAALGDVVFAEAYGTETGIGRAGGIYRSLDAGGVWTPADSGLPYSGVVYSPVSCGARLFAGTDQNGARVSHDTGRTWVPLLTDFGTPVRGNPRQLTGGNIVFVDRSVLYRSVDCGDHWTLLTPTWMADRFVESFAILGDLLIAGVRANSAASDVFISRDNGSTWSAVGPGWPSQAAAVSLAVTNTHLLAGTSNHGIFRSSDLGSTWTAPDEGLSDGVVSHMVVTGNHAFGAGQFTGVWYSRDNGSTWKGVNDGLPSGGIASLAVAAGYVFVGTLGGEVWRHSLAEMVAGTRPRKSASGPDFGSRLASVLRPGARVDFELPRRARVKLDILDLRGKAVAALADAVMAPGTHHARLPAGDLPDGAYLLRLQADGVARTRRFVRMD